MTGHAIFRIILTIILGLWLCSVAAVAANGRRDPAIASEGNPKLNVPHYELVMSENDAICRPLVEAYNKALQKVKLKSDGATSIEWDRPSELQSIGMTPLHGEDLPDGMDHADIFNEGAPRILFFEDVFRGEDPITDDVVVMKRGVTAEKLFEVVPVSIISYRKANMIDFFITPNATKQPELMHNPQRGYFLTKWPNFFEYYNSKNHHLHQNDVPDINNDVPDINGAGNESMTIRGYKFQGNIYFIADAYTGPNPSPRVTHNSCLPGSNRPALIRRLLYFSEYKPRNAGNKEMSNTLTLWRDTITDHFENAVPAFATSGQNPFYYETKTSTLNFG